MFFFVFVFVLFCFVLFGACNNVYDTTWATTLRSRSILTVRGDCGIFFVSFCSERVTMSIVSLPGPPHYAPHYDDGDCGIFFVSFCSESVTMSMTLPGAPHSGPSLESCQSAL